MKIRRYFWMLLMVAGFAAIMGVISHWRVARLLKPAALSPISAISAISGVSASLPVAAPAAANTNRAAVLLAFQEADPIQRSVKFGTAFANWFEHHPEDALAWLRQMPPGNEYNQAMFIVLQAICQTDPQRALALAASLATTHEQRFVYNALFDQIARRDLTAAVSDLQYIPAGEARENALRTVADNYQTKDTAGALAWSKNLNDTSERTIAMESVLAGLAQTNPKHAAELALQNLDGGALDRVLEKSLKQLTASDLPAAASLVSQLPAGELQKNTAIEVARALALQDPANAISWQQSLPAATQPLILNNVLDVWLQQDPAAAGKYVAEMPAGAAQDTAVSHFAEDYAVKDAAAAIAWAENLASGSAQNLAIISIASGWARLDAPAATQWAASLPADGSARAESLKGAFSYWQMTDANGAGNYLKTIPETDRSFLNPSLATK